MNYKRVSYRLQYADYSRHATDRIVDEMEFCDQVYLTFFESLLSQSFDYSGTFFQKLIVKIGPPDIQSHTQPKRGYLNLSCALVICMPILRRTLDFFSRLLCMRARVYLRICVTVLAFRLK